MTAIENLNRVTTSNAPAHEGPAAAGYFDLVHEVAELKSGPQYSTTGHAARTLVKRGDLRIVVIALRRDAELKEHTTQQPVSVQVLTGHVRITLPERSVERAVGGLMVIESGVAHNVTALTDSAILVSMPWSEQAVD